ncbi:MAG: TonB-dependent receptor [Sphingomicrobium sp.]
MNYSRFAVRALLGSVCVLALAPTAHAQTQPAPTPPAAGEVGEIIVTAQNRSQNVQDVPIAISVVSGEALKSSGVTDFSSVQRVSPVLQIVNDTSNTRVSVRGVGTQSNNEAQDQSIAVDIDGEYINRPQILNAAIFDMDRVEVLRGPQGTLYGKNSTGGAVNFITRKPGKQFSVNASESYGNYNAVILEGGVNVPLGDIGGVRFAGIYSDHDGYFHHNNATFINTVAYHSSSLRRSGDDHTLGGRASLRLTPATGLTINAAIEHVKQDIHPSAYAYVNLNQAPYNAGATGCTNPGYVEVAPTTPGIQCVPANTNFLSSVNRNTYEAPATGVSDFHQKSTAVRGRLTYDFGPATFTYTGGYRTSRNTGNNSLSPAYDFTNFGATVKTQSHEARLNGTVSGIQWQVGAFYFGEKQNSSGGLYIPCIVNATNACLTTAELPPFLAFLTTAFGANGSYLNYFRHPTDSKSKSVFGQVEVPIVTDKLVAVAGARYTSDKRSATFLNYPSPFSLGFPCNPVVPTCNSGPVELPVPAGLTAPTLRSKSNKFTWLAGLNYTPNSDLLVYVKASTGFKAGGFDGTGTSFRPETNTAYEGGVKYSIAPRSFVNLAGFYYKYKDLQNEVLLNANLGGQTFNAGKATIWGAELETQYKLTQNDTLTASANYLHAKYDSFLASYNVIDFSSAGLTSPLPADNVDLAGKTLPLAPKLVLTLGYNHVFELGSAGSLTASAFTKYKSKYFLDFYNYNDSKQKGYMQTDASLEWKSRNGHHSVQAFVRNIQDKRPLVYSTYIAAGNDDIYNWAFGAPRTYGVRLSLDY